MYQLCRRLAFNPAMHAHRWRPSWLRGAGCRMSLSAATPPGQSRRWPRWLRRTRPSGKQPRCSGGACIQSQLWTARRGSTCRSAGIHCMPAPPCSFPWLLRQHRLPDCMLAAFLVCRSVLGAWLSTAAAHNDTHPSQGMLLNYLHSGVPTIGSRTLLPPARCWHALAGGGHS